MSSSLRSSNNHAAESKGRFRSSYPITDWEDCESTADKWWWDEKLEDPQSYRRKARKKDLPSEDPEPSKPNTKAKPKHKGTTKEQFKSKSHARNVKGQIAIVSHPKRLSVPPNSSWRIAIKPNRRKLTVMPESRREGKGRKWKKQDMQPGVNVKPDKLKKPARDTKRGHHSKFDSGETTRLTSMLSSLTSLVQNRIFKLLAGHFTAQSTMLSSVHDEHSTHIQREILSPSQRFLQCALRNIAWKLTRCDVAIMI